MSDGVETLPQVVSVNSIGVGPPSNTVTATTAEEGEFDLLLFSLLSLFLFVLSFIILFSF